MVRLPRPGQDSGIWGDLLNEYLSAEHNNDGTLKVRTDGTLDAFYKKPGTGIPLADLDPTGQTRMSQAASAYQKPAGGIPKTDFATAVQTVLDNAVTSSNLSLNVKNYGAVGNGAADDTTAIRSALQAAAAAGGATVVVPKGTYMITSELSLPANTTLVGEGQNSVLKRKTGSSSLLINILRIDSVSNVRVTNLRIDAQKDDIITNYSSTALDGSHIYITCNGIYVTGANGTPSTNITIDHCWLHDAYFGNIELDNVDGMVITNNYLYNGRDNQINGRVNYGVNGYCRNVTVSNNVVLGAGVITTANQFSGIQFIRGEYLTITANVCRGFGNTSTSEGNGIGLEGCRHATIADNVCTHNLFQGIKVDRTTEGAPSVWDAQTSYVPGDVAQYGSRFFTAATYTNATPPSSAASDANWTFMASGSSTQNSVDITITGNVAANNNYFTSNGLSSTGIFVQYATDVIVEGNTVYGNYQGITNGSNCRSLTIKNNTVFNNQKMGIAFWNNLNAYGPFVIDGNYVAYNREKGIDVVVPTTITNNVLHANGQGGNFSGIGINITGTSVQAKPYFLIANNVLSDNTDDGIIVGGGFSYAVPIDIRNNYAPASTIQRRFLGENGSPVRCVGNRVGTQSVELWYFVNTSSVWIDEKSQQLVKVTSNYTVGADDQVVAVTPAANTTITLPAPNATHPSASPGRMVTVTKAGASANTVTVATAGGSILAPTTVTDSSAQRYVSDGTNWLAA